MGGAQAIGALAYGTESVRAGRRDRRARQRLGDRGQAPGVRARSASTGWRARASWSWWPSAGADPELIALDLLAQAEHGEDSPLWADLARPGAAGRDRRRGRAAGAGAAERRPTPSCRRCGAERRARRCAIAERDRARAPRAGRARRPRRWPTGCAARAACSSARGAGTAFGDYVAGSNHVLPTGGAARFQSALSPATFRRRMARVSLPGEAPARLAPAGAALARAEGFPVHAESMERRA